MAGERRRAGGLAELLVDLESAAHIPAKQRGVKISTVVERVCSAAYDDGLPSASLAQLVDTITLPSELDQASVANLIKSLYPASKVSDTVVVRVVGCLGHGQAKPAYPAQAALLKWLVMVYDVLENQRILSQLYGILFNLLDTLAIRPQLCHVLSLITRRKHVRPFRIQVLMELTRQAGNDPSLVGLMRVYKDYYPDVIVGDVTMGRASVFKHPNPEWRQRLGEIQEAYFQRTQESLPPEQRRFRINRKAVGGGRQSKSSVIPELHTSHAQESSTTLEEIENVDDFVRRLEKIELPNQMVSVMGDPLLQKYLQLMSSTVTMTRMDNWLLAFFEDQLQDVGASERSILEMLGAIRGYTRFTKQIPQACLTYLQSMMYSWNGTTGREVILDILVYIDMGPFDELYQSTFKQLEDAILDDSTESKLALLLFYRDILHQWTVSLLSQSHPPARAGSAISSLITHANTLALVIMQGSSALNAQSTILNFYEETAFLVSHPALKEAVRITIPPAELIYTLHFTFSLSILSRICSVLALYKRAFEVAMSPNPPTLDQPSYPKDYVNHFNGFLMDICNCIWRSRAFNTSDVNALGCLIPASDILMLSKYVSSLDTSLSLATLFSLSFSPVFCLLAISSVRDLEDTEGVEVIEKRHAGPVTQASLKQLEKDGGLKLPWPNYRLGVLHYLEDRGAKGVGELMYNTMKHLMSGRDNKA